MTDEPLLARTCPVCGDPYWSHDLESLAACMDNIAYDGDRPRPTERVTVDGSVL